MILNQIKSQLNTVRIGDELIRYGSVSEEKPFVIMIASVGLLIHKPLCMQPGIQQ